MSFTFLQKMTPRPVASDSICRPAVGLNGPPPRSIGSRCPRGKMRLHNPEGLVFRSTTLKLAFALLCILIVAQRATAQDRDEFDSYKVKLDGFWAYSSPSGVFRGANDPTNINLQGTLHFNSYSTLSGKLDWKFTHKNHFYVAGTAFNSSRQVVLNRTIVFQGQTFQVGTTVQGSLSTPVYVFGYQYDIIRKRRGHLGIGIQADVFNTRAAISAAAQVVGGVGQPSLHASASLVAPIPVAGPEFRIYLANSRRVFLDGNIYGMYLFGYGNFISSAGVLGVSLTRRIALKAGYQLGSRLVVNAATSSDRIGITMSQRGPLAGIEFSF